MKHVQTIFCDDIRQEVGVVVDALATDVPVTVRVLKDERVLAERDVQTRDPLESPSASGSTDDAGHDRVKTLNSFFVFSPLQIDSPCVLRVRVKIGDEELKGVGLGVARLQAPG